MSRLTFLRRGQRKANASMVDTCVIDRITGHTQDDFSGTETDTYTVIYDGQCRFQQEQIQAEQFDVGQDYQLLQRMELQIPMTVIGVETGDRVTATTSRDPDLVSRQFLVRNLAHKTEATARRLTVTERTD